MKRALMAAMAALAGCEAPPPAPPPGALVVVGVVVETRGWCHEIKGDDGARYAVHYGQLGAIGPGARVRLVGHIAPEQDCPGARVIKLAWRAEQIR